MGLRVQSVTEGRSGQQKYNIQEVEDEYCPQLASSCDSVKDPSQGNGAAHNGQVFFSVSIKLIEIISFRRA